MNFKELLSKVRELDLAQGTFAIFGSGPMAVRDLKEPNDLDIIVTKEVYEKFKSVDGWIEKLFHEGEDYYLEKDGIELWNTWGPGDWDIANMIETAEMIEGLPYVTLDHVLAWKKKNNRQKDIIDIAKIKKYLTGI